MASWERALSRSVAQPSCSRVELSSLGERRTAWCMSLPPTRAALAGQDCARQVVDRYFWISRCGNLSALPVVLRMSRELAQSRKAR